MLLRETIHWLVMNVNDMRYWAFQMKTTEIKMIPFADIKGIWILHPTPYDDRLGQYDPLLSSMIAGQSPNFFQMQGLGNETELQQDIQKAQDPIGGPRNISVRDGLGFQRKKKRKKTKEHTVVTAEQRYANKLQRDTVVRTSVNLLEKGFEDTSFLVKMHVRGSQYLLVDQNTGKEYWGKWKMSTDEWSFWRDDYQESKASNGNGNASGDHRSSCCYTLNHHRLANRAFCAACEHDTPSNRTARRIQNGGPEQTVIFNGDGSLTQKWNQRQKQRIQDIKKREKKEMEDFE